MNQIRCQIENQIADQSFVKNQNSNLVSDPINNHLRLEIWWPTYVQIIRQIKIPIWDQIDSQKQTN